MPLRPSRFRLIQIPRGIINRPAKNGPGRTRNARMPRYGFSTPPRSVIGNKKSQKTVAVVTITTPARLIQLLDRWTTGDSQPRPLRSELLGVIACKSVSRNLRFHRRYVFLRELLSLYTTTGQERGVQRVDIGIENGGVQVPDHNRHGCQDGFVEVDGSGDVQKALGKHSHDEIVGPKQQTGGNHDHGAPDHSPVLGLLDIAMGGARRRLGTET